MKKELKIYKVPAWVKIYITREVEAESYNQACSETVDSLAGWEPQLTEKMTANRLKIVGRSFGVNWDKEEEGRSKSGKSRVRIIEKNRE
jgi:hypothetical protein